MKIFIAASSLLSLAAAVTIAHYDDTGCFGDFVTKGDGLPNVCTNINIGDCCGESGLFGSSVAGSFDDTKAVAANFEAYSQQMGSGDACQTFIQRVAMDQDGKKYVCSSVPDTMLDSISGGKVVSSGGAKARRGVRRTPNGHSLAIGDVMYIIDGKGTPKAREFAALKTREEKRDYMKRNADRMTKIDFRA